MTRSLFAILTAAIIALAGCSQASNSHPSTRVWSVRDSGATGDGTTKETVAFQKTLDTCAISGGGEVLVPPGKYLIGSIQIGNRTTLHLASGATLIGSPDAADYPTIDIRWEGRWQPGRRSLLYAANVDHIAIVGPGSIEGNSAMAAPQNPRGALILECTSCNDVRWEKLSITQGGNWATHPTYCNNVVIRGLHIVGKRDGIDVDSCNNVRIENCDLDTGDDCISLKSGRGLDGARTARPTENVLITHCTMIGRRFACIGIGSETSAGVRNVRIEHSTLTPFRDAIYIKTRIGRAGATDNISADDLHIIGGGGASFLRINLTTAGNTNTADDAVPGPLGFPSASNLCFSHITLENVKTLADVTKISPDKPLERLKLSDITGTVTTGILLAHIRDVSLSYIHVTGLKGPLLRTADVTGHGLESALPLQPPATRTTP